MGLKILFLLHLLLKRKNEKGRIMNTDSNEDAPPDSSLIRGIREEKETSKQLKLYNRQLRDINKKLRRRYAVLKAELANISNEADYYDRQIKEKENLSYLLAEQIYLSYVKAFKSNKSGRTK